MLFKVCVFPKLLEVLRKILVTLDVLQYEFVKTNVH